MEKYAMFMDRRINIVKMIKIIQYANPTDLLILLNSDIFRIRAQNLKIVYLTQKTE